MKLDKRYIRNTQALSEKESASLFDKTVAVAGCGGLGGYVIESLARMGVGTIIAIDSDVFEETNLNRQLFSTENNLDQPKATAAQERIAQINSQVKIIPKIVELGEENASDLIKDADCAVDCLDNMMARFWLAHTCQTKQVPLIYGAIAGWFGQVSTVFPGDIGFVNIYGSTKSDGEKNQGNLSFTAACVASHMSAECIKVLLKKQDLLRNRLLMVDMLYGSCEIIEFN